MKKATSVDEYIASAPRELQSKLIALRETIKKAAPQAQEKISYGMPYYGYKGRLAYFRYSKAHLGLYIPPPVIEEHKNELKSFGTATSTVRFPLDENLPTSLIEKLVKARVKINEEAAKK